MLYFVLMFFFVIDDRNVGGIVAGVIVALLAVGLLLFGLWFASKKGYLPSKFSLHKCVCLREKERERDRLTIIIINSK